MHALKSAFQRVGMWPLDPPRVSWEELSKGAHSPVVPDIDLKRLMARLTPVARKDMARPVVLNGTLSTAGSAAVLTAPAVISALESLDTAKET